MEEMYWVTEEAREKSSTGGGREGRWGELAVIVRESVAAAGRGGGGLEADCRECRRGRCRV